LSEFLSRFLKNRVSWSCCSVKNWEPQWLI